MKRAELVLKCVKGYIMENSAWGDDESRTVQLTLPAEVSDELFDSISHLLSSIFHVSSTLTLQS